MFTSIAFFLLAWLFLGLTLYTWVKKDSWWCVVFILGAFLFGCMYVDHTFYDGVWFNMLAEWLTMKADTYDQAQ